VIGNILTLIDVVIDEQCTILSHDHPLPFGLPLLQRRILISPSIYHRLHMALGKVKRRNEILIPLILRKVVENAAEP
jgi:hypothetical protein